MRLYELAEKYHSDKLYYHSYIKKYTELFEGMQVKKLLEIGIGHKDLMQPFLPEGIEYVHGSSLKMWEEYFPDAQIYGCDIRLDTMFKEGRIQTALVDQSLPEDLIRLMQWSGGDFDVVIDDGSHLGTDQENTYRTLWPFMKKGSLYVIEDIWPEAGIHIAAKYEGELWIGEKGRDDNLVIFKR
jgi:hypothetical protein